MLYVEGTLTNHGWILFFLYQNQVWGWFHYDMGILFIQGHWCYKLSTVEWMVACTGRFFRNLQLLEDMVGIPCFNTTMIPNIAENMQKNGLKINVLVLSIDQISLLSWIQLRICGTLWTLTFISGIHKISSN